MHIPLIYKCITSQWTKFSKHDDNTKQDTCSIPISFSGALLIHLRLAALLLSAAVFLFFYYSVITVYDSLVHTIKWCFIVVRLNDERS